MATPQHHDTIALATTVPRDRVLSGLEYGAEIVLNGRPAHYVRPAGVRTWGVAFTHPEPADTLTDVERVNDIHSDLVRWDGLPPELLPAAALIVERGGIRAAVEVEDLQAVLGEAWPRLEEALQANGHGASPTLAGSAVLAALESLRQPITPDSRPVSEPEAPATGGHDTAPEQPANPLTRDNLAGQLEAVRSVIGYLQDMNHAIAEAQCQGEAPDGGSEGEFLILQMVQEALDYAAGQAAAR